MRSEEEIIERVRFLQTQITAMNDLGIWNRYSSEKRKMSFELRILQWVLHDRKRIWNR